MAAWKTEAISREATALRELLVAAGVKGLRPIALEDDAPRETRAFWEALGWSDAFAALHLVEPTRAASTKRAKARLAEWRKSGMSKLVIDDLPERFRVIDDDGAGVGFGIADESSGKPVVCAVLCDTNAVKRTKQSYVETVARRLLRGLVLAKQRSLGIDLDSTDELARGSEPMPTLAPGLRVLADGLALAPSERTIAVLTFARASLVFDWIDTLETNRLGASLPLDALPMFDRREDVLARTKVKRAFRGTKSMPDTLVVGAIEGVRVLIAHDGKKACAIWSEDQTKVGAIFSGASPTAKAWPRPGLGEGPPFEDHAWPAALDEAAFAAAVEGFTAIGRELGRKATGAAPKKTPTRLAAVARLNDEILEPLASGRPSGRSAAGEAWLPAGLELPKHHRWLDGGTIGAETWAAITDEDTPSDDPPALFLASWNRRVVLAAAFASTTLVRAALDRWSKGNQAAAWFPRGMPKDAPVLLAAFGLRAARLGAGVVHLSCSGVVFRDPLAYATFLLTLDDEARGSFQPPLSSARFDAPSPKKKSKGPHPLAPSALADAGFRAGPVVSSTSRKGDSIAVGIVDGVPIWVLLSEGPKRKGIPKLVCAHADATRVKAWAAKRVAT